MCWMGCRHEQKSGPNMGDCTYVELPNGWLCPHEREDDEEETDGDD